MFIEAPTSSLTLHPHPQASTNIDVHRLWAYPVANAGDAMDRLNMMDSGIVTQWSGGRCVGPALTVLTRDGDNLAIHRALDDALPGDVLVINALGGAARAVFGDLLAEICLAAGVVGVVIDGLIRDRAAIQELGLPVWARGVSPAGPFKNGPGSVAAPIACGGVVVNPGDFITADDDGVAVIPGDQAEGIMKRLVEIDKSEDSLRSRIRASVSSRTPVL